MADQASLAPAPTREVVGELLFSQLEMLVELHGSVNADLGLKVAIGQLALGNTEKALAVLQELHAADQDRGRRLDEMMQRQKELMHRFAGEPHA